MELFKAHPKPWVIKLIKEGVDPKRYDGNYIIADSNGDEVILSGNNSHEQEINLCSVSASDLVDIINSFKQH